MRAAWILLCCWCFAAPAAAAPNLTQLRKGCYGKPLPKRAPYTEDTRKAIDAGTNALRAEREGDWKLAVKGYELALRLGGEQPGLVDKLAVAAGHLGRSRQASACRNLARALPKGHPARPPPAAPAPPPPPAGTR